MDNHVWRGVALGASLTLLLGSGLAVKSGQVPPEFSGGPWLNVAGPGIAGDTGPNLAALKGKVVIVNFWVYSCINCHNSLPTLRAWYDTYKRQGLEIVGVHTPEFESDKPTANVLASLREDGVVWPILQDNARKNWRTWGVQAWPTFVLLDRTGKVRALHRGEISTHFPQAIPSLEATLRTLLAEPATP